MLKWCDRLSDWYYMHTLLYIVPMSTFSHKNDYVIFVINERLRYDYVISKSLRLIHIVWFILYESCSVSNQIAKTFFWLDSSAAIKTVWLGSAISVNRKTYFNGKHIFTHMMYIWLIVTHNDSWWLITMHRDSSSLMVTHHES